MNKDRSVLAGPIRTERFCLAPVGDHDANAAQTLDLMKMTILLHARSQIHLQVSTPPSGNTFYQSFHGALERVEIHPRQMVKGPSAPSAAGSITSSDTSGSF